MVDITRAKDVLLDLPYISDLSERSYSKKGSACGVQCKMLLKDRSVSLFIGIPEAWNRELVSIYVEDYAAMPFMPHVGADGNLCLFDLEGVLIDHDFGGLLKQCVEKAKVILEEGLYSNNDSEFAREFSSYWAMLTPSRCMKFALPKNHKTQIIKYCDLAPVVRRKKEENYAAFMSRQRGAEIFAAAEQNYFTAWDVSGTQLRGVFFHLEADQYILPPDLRKPISLEYVRTLMSYIPVSELTQCKPALKSDSLIVFEVIEPGLEVACFGIMLKNVWIDMDEGCASIRPEKGKCEIIAVDVTRIDDEFLQQRTRSGFKGQMPKVLLIGCGSIGGYLCGEMV